MAKYFGYLINHLPFGLLNFTTYKYNMFHNVVEKFEIVKANYKYELYCCKKLNI